jgi:hypothetical protein
VIVLRSLFLLLVLLNLGLLATFAWFVDEPASRPAYDGPGITLLRELDPATMRRAGAPAALARRTGAVAAEAEAAEGADPADANAPEGFPDDFSAELPEDFPDDAGVAAADFALAAPGPAAAGCISIGPFSLPTQADAAAEALTAEGFAPRRTTRETEVWDGYWVFIETIGDQAEARAIAADLAENGIGDTQVIASSERGTLLSIGVFSDIARAATQADRVDDAGYSATIADSMRTTQTHWLDVELTSEDSIGLDTLAEPGRISRLEQRACVADDATD